MSMSQLDPGQVIKSAFDDTTGGLKVKTIAGTLVTEPFDEVILTYVAAGDGAGEIETVTYKNASVTVATLTLGYDSEDRLISVVRS